MAVEEYRTCEWSHLVPQRQDAERTLNSRHRVRFPIDQAIAAIFQDRLLHRRGHRKCGSKRTHCRNADADCEAETTKLRKSFRSASEPADSSILGPPPWKERAQESRTPQAGDATPRQSDFRGDGSRCWQWMTKVLASPKVSDMNNCSQTLALTSTAISVPRNNRGFYISVAVEHVMKNLL